MPKKDNEVCAACHYFEKIDDGVSKTASGTCCFSPPVVVVFKQDTTVSVRPSVFSFTIGGACFTKKGFPK